jgi:hypothetical protein
LKVRPQPQFSLLLMKEPKIAPIKFPNGVESGRAEIVADLKIGWNNKLTAFRLESLRVRIEIFPHTIQGS